MISRSVAQIATASIRTSTSAFFGTGTALVASVSWSGSPSTHARMVSGIGKSGDVLTWACWYMLSPRACGLFCCLGADGFARRTRRRAELHRQFIGRHQKMDADLVEIFRCRPEHRRGDADRSDDAAGMVANGGADADHTGLKLFPIDRKAVAACQAKLFLELLEVDNGVRCKG